MNSDNLKGVSRQLVSRPLPECRARELELPLASGKVVGLTGVCRSGKTFLFFHPSSGCWRKGSDALDSST